jgi:hypothetical protein
MKKKFRVYLLSISLLLLLSSANVLLIYAQPIVEFKVTRVVWGEDPDSPSKAYPGDTEQSLTVEVQNLSQNETIKGIIATLMLEDGPFTDIYGESNATATGEPRISEPLDPTDMVLPKGFFLLTFSLNIDEDVLPGSYSYNMLVEYSVNSTGVFIEGEPQILTVEFIISQIESSITCSVSPTSIEKGESIDVSGTITPIQDNITVILEYKKPDDSILTRTVKTNVEGSYRESYQPDLEGIWSVNASWSGDEKHEGNWIHTSFEVKYPVSIKVFTSNNRLTGGLDNQFNISLLNDGGVSLSTINVILNIPQPLIIHGDNQWTIEYLEPGNSTLITVQIFVPDSSLGATYAGSLNLDYRDYYGEDHSESNPLGFIIKGQIEMIVYSISANPQPVDPESTASITGTLLNKGNIVAKYVTVSIPSNPVVQLTGESTIYLGEIEENAPAPFSLTVNINSSIQDGTYPVDISITYRDDQYVDHTFNVTTYLIVEKSEDGQNGSDETNGFNISPYEAGIVLSVIIAASLIIFWLYRREKIKRKIQTSRNSK